MRSRFRLSWAGMWLLILLANWGAPSIAGADYFELMSPEQLVGTWTAKVGEREQVITFAADGTFRGKSYHGGVLGDEYTGTRKLEVDGNRKAQGYVPQKISYVYLTSKVIPAGTKDEDAVMDRIFEARTDSTWLLLLTKSGVKRAYRKLGKNESS